MSALARALAGFSATSGPEAGDLARIEGLAALGDPWSREHPLHLTASALILDPAGERVLLRWHARIGRWLQVGGHGDPGEDDPWVIACREAEEESGLVDLRAPRPELERRLVQVAVVSVPAREDEPAHEHADLRYLLATDHPEEAVAERKTAPLRWVSLAEAEAEASEESFRVLLERAGELAFH